MKNQEKNPGFLLFYDWFDLIEDLSPKEYKMIHSAMVNYQRYGIEPPEFPSKIKKIAKVIFSQLDRRIVNAENGRRGGEARVRREKNEKMPQGSLQARPQAAAEASPAASQTAYRVEENREEEIRQENKYLLSDESAYLCGSCEPQTHNENARSEREKEDRKAYGRHKNVMLYPHEYEALLKEIPNTEEYVNIFSDKLATKGYRYADHYAALRSWWERDKDLVLKREQNRGAEFGKYGEYSDTCGSYGQGSDNGYGEGHYGSFDTDDFFNAAVRRALGED